jgi:DNA-binding beta-propeller fold protein YncE
MTITALTNLPSTSDQANFVTKVDALFAKLATLKSEITAQIGAAHTALSAAPGFASPSTIAADTNAFFASLAVFVGEINVLYPGALTVLPTLPNPAAVTAAECDAFIAALATLVTEINVASAWDLSTGSYASKSLSVTAQENTPTSLAFSADGTKAYVVGTTNDTIYQYTLSTAWDVSTGSYASKSLSVTAQENAPYGLAFRADGTKAYVVGITNKTIYQYTLSTAWDISTGSYASKSLSVTAQDTAPAGLAFSADGTKAYVVGDTNNTIYQYTLSTAWDISTGSYASKSLSVSAQETLPADIAFSLNGTKLYVMGYGGQRIYQYTLSTAWDISTGSYASKSLLVSAQEGGPQGVAFSANGTQVYVVGPANDTIYQYELLP